MNQSLLIEMAASTIAFRRNISRSHPMDFSLEDIDSICSEVDTLLKDSHLWNFLVDHHDVTREDILQNIFEISEEEFIEHFLVV